MYRKRRRGSRKYNEKMAVMRRGKERKRLEREPPYYPPDPTTDALREIIIIDRVGATTTHHFKLYDSGPGHRCDNFRVVVDGQTLGVLGWSKTMVRAREAFIRPGAFV